MSYADRVDNIFYLSMSILAYQKRADNVLILSEGRG